VLLKGMSALGKKTARVCDLCFISSSTPGALPEQLPAEAGGVSHVRLFWHGEEMREELTLDDYCVLPKSLLHVEVELTGVAFKDSMTIADIKSGSISSPSTGLLRSHSSLINQDLRLAKSGPLPQMYGNALRANWKMRFVWQIVAPLFFSLIDGSLFFSSTH
jgi:hypothetical protein